jgi:hypothetical protein
LVAVLTEVLAAVLAAKSAAEDTEIVSSSGFCFLQCQIGIV